MKARSRHLPTSLDTDFCDAVDALTTRMLGRNDVRGEALAKALAALSEVYTGASQGERSPVLLQHTASLSAFAARARFFFLRDLPKIALPLEELRTAGALPTNRTWRVLDVGAGLGAMSLGVAHFAKVHGLADRIEVLAIDHDARSLTWMKEFAKLTQGTATLSTLCAEVHVETRTVDVTRHDAFASFGSFDLVVMGFTLNELFEEREESDATLQRAQVLRSCARALSEQGSVVVLEPALKGTSRALHRVRDLLVAENALTIFAPCLRGDGCPMLESERDWCHEAIPYALPGPTAELARAAGLRFEGLSFSYLTLRRDGVRLSEALSGDGGVLFRTVSDPLPSKGKHELFGCGAPGRVRLMQLGRDVSDASEAFLSLGRGDLFSLVADSAANQQPSETKYKLASSDRLLVKKDLSDPLLRFRSL